MTERIEVTETDPLWHRREYGESEDDREDFEEAMRESLDADAAEAGASEKLWVPYEGPRGGEGWREVESGRIEYRNDPPGETAETPEEIAEHLDDGTVADPKTATDADGKVRVGLARDAEVYTINGRPAAPLVVEAGQEISFEVDSPGVPVYLSESPGGGDYTDPVETNVLVENAHDDRYATATGRLILQTTRDQDRLYYCSANKDGMGGLIQVVQPGDVPGRAEHMVAEKAASRVYVDNVHEAPDDKVVHSDPDNGLYYEEEPAEPDGADETVGLLERFADALGLD